MNAPTGFVMTDCGMYSDAACITATTEATILQESLIIFAPIIAPYYAIVAFAKNSHSQLIY